MRPSERCLRGAARPPALADLPEPPEVLYLRGELARAPAVAIIGTRAPSPGALGYTRSLASALGRAGVTIVSGGAVGIDAAAHEGALDAGGSCLVVAPSGYERPFPRENAPLFRAVVERGGAYLSLVPGDVPASRGAFFLRNAVLVALADLVILVEAPYRSGARNAAAAAHRLG
ncbi:MAG: DNA-processing protein DprA, partial [Sorangiineae bacterium]|nr:DNA-processing protein DprA [Sorangiineae bacterium]